jgi:hypothetical protein
VWPMIMGTGLLLTFFPSAKVALALGHSRSVTSSNHWFSHMTHLEASDQDIAATAQDGKYGSKL